MAQEKLLANSRRNLSKAQRDARQKAEDLVVTNATKPKMNEVTKSNSALRKLFNQLKKVNDHFTEADSISLNTLVFNLYMKVSHEQELTKLDMLDENYERFLIRIEKFSKMINESMKQLCIPLNARLSLANDMAKVMIEEKKLEQMNNQETQKVNPLYQLLQEIDDLE